MNRKVYRLFSAVMVLVMAVTLSGIGLIQGAAPAEAITALKWVEIPTPDEDDFQLYPTSDVGVTAVTPDGATLFAAVWNDSSSDWHIFKSMDGGYTWSETGYYNNVVVGWGDNSDIVDIVAHPLWETRPYLYVATQTRTYYSQNGGNSFLLLGNALPGGTQINCMDVAVNKDSETRVAIGTGVETAPGGVPTYEAGNDVYLLYDTWVRQGVYKNFQPLLPGLGIDIVLDVAFAPTYGEETMTGSGWIFALVRGTHVQGGVPVDQAVLRCETQEVASTGDIGNWGAPVSDGVFYHNGIVETCPIGPNQAGILADRGRMAFAEDFANQQSVFVGLNASGPGGACGTGPRGDVFRCDVSTDIVSPSTYEDLNVVRTPTGDRLECNIWSLDVSGDADTAYILAGLRKSDIAGALSTWQSPVHFSSDGGATWMPSYKPPSGITDFAQQKGEPNVVMAPDFGSSGIAYCGTAGLLSGMWVSVSDGTTWNGRGLLDMMTLRISSIAVSPNYASDETMFMVQSMQTYPIFGAPYGWLGIPWQTEDAGGHWEVIIAENLLFPLPGVNAEWVELPHDWPSDDTIFLTGRNNPLDGLAQSMVVQSRDGGNTFTNFISGPSVTGTARPPYTGASWDTPDADTIIIGDMKGTVYITENAGMTWCAREGSYPCSQQNSIPMDEAITDLVEKDGALLIGTEDGGVYLCPDWQVDFNIQRVGNYVGTTNDWTSVAFDANYDTNDVIYCGLYKTGASTNGEVLRCNLGEGTTWEQISDTRNTNVPTKWVAPPVHFGDPPVNGPSPMWVGSKTLDLSVASPYPWIPAGGGALKCGEEGTLYALDINFNASNQVGNLSWRCTDPELETITLGEEPLWEPLGDGLGVPFETLKGSLTGDLEVVTGSNILFAIGLDKENNPTIWTYHDTLTAGLGPLDLIRPADEAIGVGTLATDNTQACLTLQWEPATDATKYEWEIGTGPELKVDGGFVSLWAHAQFLTYFEGDADTARFTNGEAIAGCLPPGETYYWHVRVVQPFQSPWSEIWSFTTMPTSTGERPLLTSPANGATNVIRRPAFTWTQAVGAGNYELTVWECANAGSPIIGPVDVTGLSYQATQDLKYSTNYCWNVKAIGGNNPVSASSTFTTLAAPEEVEEEGTPYWVWVVIGVSALMLVAVIVLIVLTKKA